VEAWKEKELKEQVLRDLRSEQVDVEDLAAKYQISLENTSRQTTSVDWRTHNK